MTNAELIAKIRAEIERLKGIGVIVPLDNREQKTGYESALIDIETFLDTLESEKPMNQEDIDTEIGHWMDCLDDKYCMLVPHYSIQDIKYTARHFAQWGAEHLKK